jgi:hypothetical protein
LYEDISLPGKIVVFLFGEEKLVAPLIALPNVDFAIRRQKKGKN